MRDFNMALSAQKPNHVHVAKKSPSPAFKPSWLLKKTG
jgi:hypothetical protein